MTTDATPDMCTTADVFETLKYNVIAKNGGQYYFNADNQLHRDEGPAVITASGAMFWCQYGERHRVGGPAAIYSTGSRVWYQNGKLHRTDGPACVWAHGVVQWYLDGVELDEHEFKLKVKTYHA